MAWYQDESSATLFPSLNHDQTKPHAMWVGAATPAKLALDLIEWSLSPSIAPLAHFQQSGGVLRLMLLGIKMNPLQDSSLASIMIKPSLIQCGLAVRHLQGLPWISTSDI